MLNSFSNAMVILAVFIALVGQALASESMACEMMVSSAQSHAAMGHTSFNADEDMHRKEVPFTGPHSDECCGAECVCLTSTCASATSCITDAGLLVFSGMGEAANIQYLQNPISITTFLYRPPIFV